VISVVYKGLSVVACPSKWGAVGEESGTQGEVSECNFASLVGSMVGSEYQGAAALGQGGNARSSTSANCLLFVNSARARGCWWCDLAGEAKFEACSFVDNLISAITFWNYEPRVCVRSCYFKETGVVYNWGSTVSGGARVTVEACLFVGAVPSMPTRVTLTGVQVSFTSTEIEFNTASMLPTCRGLTGIFGETRMNWNDPVDDIEQVTVHRPSPTNPPTGSSGLVEVELTIFHDIFYTGDGAAISIDSSALVVSIRRDGFFDCTAVSRSASDGSSGGGVSLKPAGEGSSIIDSCGSECSARSGGFVLVEVGADVAFDVVFKGLSVLACSSRWGAVSAEEWTEARVSECNFTSLGEIPSGGATYGAAALNQGGNNLSSTDAIYLLFVGCDRARGCWFCDQPATGDATRVSTFESCSFVDNSIEAIAIRNGAQVHALLCYFEGSGAVKNWAADLGG
jgi:hypothetical protein